MGTDARPDQLSLDLAAGFPRLPAGLRPMLPRPAAEPFDSDRHLFEPAWGGRRALAFLEAAVEADGRGGWLTADGRGSVRLVDAVGRDVLERLPELRALPLRLESRSAVLDGELVAVDADGRCDATRLRSRLAGSGDGAVAFLVFDLLYLDGRPMLALPLTRRRELLLRAVRPGPDIVVVPAVETEGVALHAAVVAQRLAGVRARVSTSPYLPGVRSLLWRSIRADLAGRDNSPGAETHPAEPAAPAAPILAVIRRLPLDEVSTEDPRPG